MNRNPRSWRGCRKSTIRAIQWDGCEMWAVPMHGPRRPIGVTLDACEQMVAADVWEECPIAENMNYALTFPDAASPREPAESVAERIVRDTCGMVGWEHQQSAVAAIITARDAAADARIAELEKKAVGHEFDWRVRCDQVQTLQARIAELEKLVSDLRESLGTAHRRARECESKLAALESAKGEGVDAELLETARTVLASLVAKAPLLDAEGEHGPKFDKATLTKFRHDMAVSAMDYAEALHSHAALREVKL